MPVLLLITIVVFIFVSFMIWLALFPSARDAMLNFFKTIGRFVNAGTRKATVATDTVISGATQSGRVVRNSGISVFHWFQRHGFVLVIALVVLAVPPIVILALWSNPKFEPFPERNWSESQSMIAQLMRGEQLVPPPPPPPEVFMTAEVRRIRPEIVTADRRWDQINPELRQRVLAIYEVMRREGYQMVLVEGFRSPERQAELMQKGLATRAGAWQSCHQYGFAVDSAPMRNGKLQWDMNDEWTRRAYFLYGELAQQAGLEWGGSWRSLKDYVHVEMKEECRRARRERQAQLRSG